MIVGNKWIYSGWPPVSSKVIIFSTSPGWWVGGLESVTSMILLKVDKFVSFTELTKSPVNHCIMADCCGLEGLHWLLIVVSLDGDKIVSVGTCIGSPSMAVGGFVGVIEGSGSKIELK